MQIPIDIPELLKLTTDLKEVAKTPLSVSVFIDDAAPDALISHVRSAFASAGVHTRVTIAYMDESSVQVNKTDDMAVIIAGTSEFIGRQAASIRDEGVPVMVVCDYPSEVLSIAKASGYPLFEADVVAPEELGHRNPVLGAAQSGINFIRRRVASVSAKRNHKASEQDVERVRVPVDVTSGTDTTGAPVTTNQAGTGDQASLDERVHDEAEAAAIPLNEQTLSYLNDRMGEWILAACGDKELAFALSFPFVRKPLAYNSVSATSLQNGAVGFVPLLPGADLPIMTLNQAKMVLQIATAYGQSLDASRVKEIAAVVAGGFLFRNVARSITKLVPAAGWIISGAVGFAGTEAMGRAAIEYFEAGGDIVGLAKVVQTARDEAVDAARTAADTPIGKKLIGTAKTQASNAFTKLRNSSKDDD